MKKSYLKPIIEIADLTSSTFFALTPSSNDTYSYNGLNQNADTQIGFNDW